MGEMDELTALEPEFREIGVAGKALTLRPLTIGQLPAVARELRGVQIPMAGEEIDVMTLVAENGDQVARAVAIACKVEPDWVNDLQLDDFLELLMAVMELNVGFFYQQVMPSLDQAMAAVRGMAGATSSPSSSTPDTSGQS